MPSIAGAQRRLTGLRATLVGFVLVALATGAVVVWAISSSVQDGDDAAVGGRSPDPDPPATAAERQADAVARAFTALVREGDAERACGLTTGRLFRDLRCASRPRLPRTSLVAGIPDGPIAETFDADPEPRTGRVLIAIPNAIDGPLTTFAITPDGLVAELGAYGFA